MSGPAKGDDERRRLILIVEDDKKISAMAHGIADEIRAEVGQ